MSKDQKAGEQAPKETKEQTLTGFGEVDADGYQRPSKPHFIKLGPDDIVSGIFVGMVQTRFGPGYKFRNLETDAYFTVGGNRAQLDQVFAEVMERPEGYIGDTLNGHAISLKRFEDTQSGSGRKVAQYGIKHEYDKCPKGCKKL